MRLFAVLLIVSLYSFGYAQSPPVFSCFDLNPGVKSSNPTEFSICNGYLLFRAGNDTTGDELWISDGTRSGTKLLIDINPGYRLGYPEGFTELNGKQYFIATDGMHHRQLWVTDATVAGTHQVSYIDTAYTYGSALKPMINYYGSLLFWGRDSIHGYSLWTSDGTTAGTHAVIQSDSANGHIFTNSAFYLFNNRAWFYRTGQNKNELWITDGSLPGTYKVADASGSHPVIAGDHMFFVGTDSVHGKELWVTDGTTSGTRLALEMQPGTAPGCDDLYGYWNGYLYLRGRIDSTIGLIALDVQNMQTRWLKTIDISRVVQYLGVFKDRSYFCGPDPGSKKSYVFSVRGDENGTRTLFTDNGDTVMGGSFCQYKSKTYLNNLCSKKFGMYVMSSADTATVVRPDCNGVPVAAYSVLQSIEYKDAFWFVEYTDSAGQELWRMEDTSTAPITPFAIYPNPNDGHFTISTGNNNFRGRYRICDVVGREIYFGDIEGPKAIIQMPAVSTGIYMLVLQDISGGISNGAIRTYKLLLR